MRASTAARASAVRRARLDTEPGQGNRVKGRKDLLVALFYTLLESAKLSGVEPHGYVRAAAEAALAGEPPLLPHVHRQHLKQA